MVQGVQSGTADNLQLDAEGGAETKTSKTRYLRSGVAVGLAAATHDDETFNRAEGVSGRIQGGWHRNRSNCAFAAFGYCHGGIWGLSVGFLQQLHGSRDRCRFRKTYGDGD